MRKKALNILCCLLAFFMIIANVTPAWAVENETEQHVTATIEYIDETGKVEYLLEPTHIDVSQDETLLQALKEGYKDYGTIEYGLLSGVTVKPYGKDPIGEVNYGEKAWWPFVNSIRVGVKYNVSHGDVIRLIYCQNRKEGFPGYVPPQGENEQGKLNIYKDKLIQSLADFSVEQKEQNRELYEKAYQTALDLNTTQKDIETVQKQIEEILNPKIPATDINVSLDHINMLVGEEKEVTASLIPENSTDSVEWSIENTEIASVTSKGKVYGKKEGNTNLVIKANDHVSKTIPVYVDDEKANSITLDKKELSMKSGEGYRLKAIVTPESADKNLNWRSLDTSVATVDDTGLVVGVQGGTTTIIVSKGDVSAECEVTIKPRTPTHKPQVIFKHQNGMITDLKDGQITLTSLDEGAFTLEGYDHAESLYWKCKDNDGTYHLSSKGKFYPHLGTRKAEVYTKDPNLYDDAQLITEFTLNVESSNISELKLYLDGREIGNDECIYLDGSEEKEIIVKGRTQTNPEYILIPNQALQFTASKNAVIYESYDTNALIIFAQEAGQHEFSISMNDNPHVSRIIKAASKQVDVKEIDVVYPETFYIDSWNALGNQYNGITYYSYDPQSRYEVKIKPENATNKNVVWTAHQPDIAEFQETFGNGIVPKKSGSASFTISSVSNPEIKKDITICFQYKNPVKKVDIEKKEYHLKQYDSINLNIQIDPINATDQRFHWTYDKDNIVEVSDQVSIVNGQCQTKHVINALNKGTVTVTGTPIDDTNKVTPIEFTVIVGENNSSQSIDFDKYVTQNIAEAIKSLKNDLKDQYIYGSEWSIFTILRSGGQLKQTDLNHYYQSLIDELNGGRLLPTDYFRIIITLQTMGKDPTQIANRDLIKEISNYNRLDRMSSNMIFYTLVALDTMHYPDNENTKWSREKLIDMLLEFQNPQNGGFGLSNNKTVGVDITAMALQALAPYNTKEYPDVQKAIANGLDYLRKEMTPECGYIVEGGDNSCSLAQVLTALSTLGIDPLDPANGFVKGSKNIITKLNEFQCKSGGFMTLLGNQKEDMMTTAQVGYALEAYNRFVHGYNDLYDLTDVNKIPQGQIDAIAAQEVIDLINQIGNVTIESGDRIHKAREAYDLLTENQKKLVTNYPLLVQAEKIYQKLLESSHQTNNSQNEQSQQEQNHKRNNQSSSPRTDDTYPVLFFTISLICSFVIFKKIKSKV